MPAAQGTWWCHLLQKVSSVLQYDLLLEILQQRIFNATYFINVMYLYFPWSACHTLQLFHLLQPKTLTSLKTKFTRVLLSNFGLLKWLSWFFARLIFHTCMFQKDLNFRLWFIKRQFISQPKLSHFYELNPIFSH